MPRRSEGGPECERAAGWRASRVAARVVLVAMAVSGLRPFTVVHAVQTDLDAFMAVVLARRDDNWKKLQQYVLDEREQVDVRGPNGAPIWGDRHEYTWYIREGLFVRSPVTANGVNVPDDERRAYEAKYLKEAKEREASHDEPATAAAPAQAGLDLSGVLVQTRRPGFMDSAYFLKFKFEPGHYGLVGRETLNGLPVLKIEYYPAKLFSHEQNAEDQRRREKKADSGEDVEATLERMMNKVSLVTLWVEPEAHQILKYTFDNVNLDFLPAASLVRMNDLRASMTMTQPFAGVWLPENVNMMFGAMLAIGEVRVRYRLDYHDYRQAETSGRLVPTSR